MFQAAAGARMAAGSRYGVTLKQLRELMENRSHEGVDKVREGEELLMSCSGARVRRRP